MNAGTHIQDRALLPVHTEWPGTALEPAGGQRAATVHPGVLAVVRPPEQTQGLDSHALSQAMWRRTCRVGVMLRPQQAVLAWVSLPVLWIRGRVC